ncbi:MAG: flagellar type III secretion system pore protein FliP [Phycisphaerae bacterium]|nr:flagellar type III secretion system pore protein FliP [Phycisphaerae bacterium]
MLLILASASLAFADAPASPAVQDEIKPEAKPVAAKAIETAATDAAGKISESLPNVETPEGTASLIKWIVIATVLSLAPALAVMVTSFTRIIVVLGLLRQALATPQLPPNQILFGLALLMTLVVMAPVAQDIYADAVEPWMDGKVTQDQAVTACESRVRKFMIRQLEAGGNTDSVYIFLNEETAAKEKLAWKDVPTFSLIPAFVLGELKIAFMIGLRIFLPFVIIDMLVGSVLVSMGMLMLPPVLISLPFKLLMFVLADGWTLVAGTLMSSFL